MINMLEKIIKRKQQQHQEKGELVMADEEIRPLFMHIPTVLHKRLKAYAALKDMTMTEAVCDWIKSLDFRDVKNDSTE